MQRTLRAIRGQRTNSHRGVSQMDPKRPFLKLVIASLLVFPATGVFLATSVAAAQDLTPGLTYICNGEKMFIESCNMRDLSDNASCMVGHPDHVNPNGLMQYTNMTRGALKKLFPTCTQPSAKPTSRRPTISSKPPRNPSPTDNPRNQGPPKSAPQTAASPQADSPPPAWATRSSAPSARCSPQSSPARTKHPDPAPIWQVCS